MDKAQRAELLRQRFRANGGLPYVPSGRVRSKPHVPAKPTNICLQWPEANRDTARAGLWMHRPDEPEKPTVTTKRRTGVAALTKIAEKWPVKPLLPAPNQSVR